MKKELLELKQQFNIIKNSGLHKTVMNGSGGIGRTFEKLLGKQADVSSNPDYKGIEIKAKLGYTKTPLSLFCMSPKSNHLKTIDFLVNNYGYPESSFSNFKALRAEVKCHNSLLVAKKYSFNLEVDRGAEKIILVIQDKNGTILNNELYWDFTDIRERLTTKLNYMALVIAYPYYRNNETYYKYFTMTIYKLKSFEIFLRLIEEGIITISFNISICRDDENYGKIKDRGTAFKIDNTNIYKLFDKLYI